MKLTYAVNWRGQYEVRFVSRSYVTHGYGPNRLKAREQVVKNIREYIEELNAAMAEKDTWEKHGR